MQLLNKPSPRVELGTFTFLCLPTKKSSFDFFGPKSLVRSRFHTKVTLYQLSYEGIENSGCVYFKNVCVCISRTYLYLLTYTLWGGSMLDDYETFDDVRNEEYREELVENGEISAWEDAFLKGWDDAGTV